MENYIPQIAMGFVASGGSIWLRSRIARRAVENAYQVHDKSSYELKREMQRDGIEHNHALREIEQKLDRAQHPDELDSIMSDAKIADEYYTNLLKRHKQRSDYQGTLISKLEKKLRLIKYNIPVLIGIASLGLAGYEFISGNSDFGIGSLAFAIPHLFEALANQKKTAAR